MTLLLEFGQVEAKTLPKNKLPSFFCGHSVCELWKAYPVIQFTSA